MLRLALRRGGRAEAAAREEQSLKPEAEAESWLLKFSLRPDGVDDAAALTAPGIALSEAAERPGAEPSPPFGEFAGTDSNFKRTSSGPAVSPAMGSDRCRKGVDGG